MHYDFNSPITCKFVVYLRSQNTKIADKVYRNLITHQVLSEIITDEAAKTYYVRQYVMTVGGDYIRQYSYDFIRRYMHRLGYKERGCLREG